jgi:predicted transcriptional regulator
MTKDAAITVRLPLELKRRLEGRAERERRSISAQVLYELERAVAAEPGRGEESAVGLFAGARLPSNEDLAEVRTLLWGRLGGRRD